MNEMTKRLNQARKTISKSIKSFYDHVPMGLVNDLLYLHDLEAIQEDGTRWSGFFCGQEGRATIQIVDFESRKTVNSLVVLSWYKISPEKYDIVCYLS